MSELKRYTLYLVESQVETLKEIALKKHLVMADLIRQAIDEYYKKHKGD